ncbi:DEKNAAC104334 [Brettanomyces naardenensis]|uniref:DEKNAAC104334 n=1 Tax=Brettanomyces naardenensis TaxID=13370 RepID=A0A448YQL2_BRENA|nr:DEKNAAC104334 [Brettanomyces naardenensis]
MNFVQRLGSKLGLAGDEDPTKEISQILPVSEEPASCDPSQCINTYNTSCFKLKSQDITAPLWESAKPFDFHILVSTGDHDWPHDAFDQPKTVLQSISRFDYSKYGTAKLNVTSLPIPLTDSEYTKSQKADILIMPYFVWVRGVTRTNCNEVLNTVLESLVAEQPKFSDLPPEIDGAKLEKDIFRSYIFLCSHRTRDKRCGKTAPIMKKEFEAQLRDLGYYRDFGDSRPSGVCVAYVNHVGGHKFAANVLIYNKGGEFAWFARCSPLNVEPILHETVLQGKVFPEISRTVKKYNAVSW